MSTTKVPDDQPLELASDHCDHYEKAVFHLGVACLLSLKDSNRLTEAGEARLSRPWAPTTPGCRTTLPPTRHS